MKTVQEFSPESQGQYLALTVVFAPHSLDIGPRGMRCASAPPPGCSRDFCDRKTLNRRWCPKVVVCTPEGGLTRVDTPCAWQAQDKVMFYAQIFGGEQLTRTAQELAYQPHEPLTPAAPSKSARPPQPNLPRHISAVAAQPAPPAYPQRPEKAACSFYLQTGKCAYGSACKWDHPLRDAPAKAGAVAASRAKGGAAGGASHWAAPPSAAAAGAGQAQVSEPCGAGSQILYRQ